MPARALPSGFAAPYHFLISPTCLLIAKFAAYGLDHHSLTLIYDYLKYRRQRGSTFSEWLEIVLGVPPRFNFGSYIIHYLY